MRLLPQGAGLDGGGGGPSGRQSKLTETADTETSLRPGNASVTRRPKQTRKKGKRMLFDFGCLRWKQRKKKRASVERDEDKEKVVRHEKQAGNVQEEDYRDFHLPRQPHEQLGGSTTYFPGPPACPTEGNAHVTDSDSSKNKVLCRKGPSKSLTSDKVRHVYKQSFPRYSPSSHVSQEQDESLVSSRRRWRERLLCRGRPGKDTSPHSKKRRYKSPRRDEKQKAKETRRIKNKSSPESSPRRKRKIKVRLAVNLNQRIEHEHEKEMDKRDKVDDEAEKKSGGGMCVTLYVFFCLFLATALFLGVMYAFPVDEEEASFLTPQAWEIFRVELISTGLLCFGALVVLCLLRSKQSSLMELLVAFIMALFNLSIVHLPRLLFSNIGEFRYFVGPLWLVEIVVPLLVLSIIVCHLAVAELCC